MILGHFKYIDKLNKKLSGVLISPSLNDTEIIVNDQLNFFYEHKIAILNIFLFVISLKIFFKPYRIRMINHFRINPVICI
jgi:hypothetical protein